MKFWTRWRFPLCFTLVFWAASLYIYRDIELVVTDTRAQALAELGDKGVVFGRPLLVRAFDGDGYPNEALVPIEVYQHLILVLGGLVRAPVLG